MFIFAIAAMYVNTKDVSESKRQDSAEFSEERYDVAETRASKEKMDMRDIMYALDNLEQKYDELDKKVSRQQKTREASSSNNNDGMRCRIVGTRTPEGVEPLSADAALQSARVNGNDIVVTCSLR